MTTLSKEDVVRMARECGLNTEHDIITVFERFATIARADLVAENERLRDEDDARYIHSCGPKCMRAGCVNRRLRTALAAAEARETKLRGALVVCAPWLHAAYDRPPQTPEAISMLSNVDNALSIQHDDSALAEKARHGN